MIEYINLKHPNYLKIENAEEHILMTSDSKKADTEDDLVIQMLNNKPKRQELSKIDKWENDLL